MKISSAASSSIGKTDLGVCISMLDPANRGGVYTMAAELYGMLERWGWQPSLLYLSASAEDRLSPRWLLRQGRFWDTRLKTNRGMRGMAVGHVPAALRSLAYIWPYPAVWRYLAQFDMYVVLGGALRGITFAVTGKRYICWIATLFADEIRAKAALGDPWARQVLSSKSLPLILWQERFVLRRAQLVLALSDYTAHRIRTVCPQVSDRVWTVPCPIDTEAFSNHQHCEGTRSFAHAPSIMCVGRLDDPRKNIPFLLQAFQHVQTQRPDARLVLVGPYSPALVTLASEFGLDGTVQFVGPIPHGPELAHYYRRAHIFALPSQQEGLGIVVLEAMACGLPVVSTRCGGPEAHVRDGETGYLVPQGDPGAFAQALLKLLDDEELRQRLSRNATEWAQQTCSRPVVEPQFRRAFELVPPDVTR